MQSAKALPPIYDRVSGVVRLLSEVQSAKVLSPIYTRPEARVIFSRPVQPLKAARSIEYIPAGILIAVIAVLPRKAPAAILRTLEGMVGSAALPAYFISTPSPSVTYPEALLRYAVPVKASPPI